VGLHGGCYGERYCFYLSSLIPYSRVKRLKLLEYFVMVVLFFVSVFMIVVARACVCSFRIHGSAVVVRAAQA
jgi:hypothetical protein